MTLRVYHHARGMENSKVCEAIEEGEHGLYLLDGDEFLIGYVPYDSLMLVEEDTE